MSLNILNYFIKRDSLFEFKENHRTNGPFNSYIFFFLNYGIHHVIIEEMSKNNEYFSKFLLKSIIWLMQSWSFTHMRKYFKTACLNTT